MKSYKGLRFVLFGIALLAVTVAAALTGVMGDIVIDGTTPNPLVFGLGLLAVIIVVAGLASWLVEAMWDWRPPGR